MKTGQVIAVAFSALLVGVVIGRSAAKQEQLITLSPAELNARLNKLVSEEQYEAAARVRDIIALKVKASA